MAVATTMAPIALIRITIHGRISSTPIPANRFFAFSCHLFHTMVPPLD
jgi:hypothetical protein